MVNACMKVEQYKCSPGNKEKMGVANIGGEGLGILFCWFRPISYIICSHTCFFQILDQASLMSLTLTLILALTL